MKRHSIITLLCVVSVLSVFLTGCTRSKVNKTPEGLINAYIDAVQKEDYETIWSLVLPYSREQAIREGIIKDKQDGLWYIQYAVNDYYWLVEADLPSRKSYTLSMNRVEDVSLAGGNDKKAYAEVSRMIGETLKAVEDWQVEITTDDGDVICGSLFLFETESGWYLISVVGDDEFFKY